MSGRSANEAGAIMTGRVEEAVQSRANQFVACAPSRVAELTADETAADLTGRVLSRLELEFMILFRGEP
jgi:hypothetical protein